MTRCEMCGYYWWDMDEDGAPIGNAYCHYDGPDAWAPCEQDDNWKAPDDYDGYYNEED